MKKGLAIKLLKSAYPNCSNRDIVNLIAEELDVKLNVNRVHELDDNPRKCFVWDVDMTEDQIIDFTNRVQSEFTKKYNRDPQALHFIRNDINDIEELSPEEVKSRVEPWLKSQGDNE